MQPNLYNLHKLSTLWYTLYDILCLCPTLEHTMVSEYRVRKASGMAIRSHELQSNVQYLNGMLTTHEAANS